MINGWQTVLLADVLTQDTNYVTELEPIIYPKLSVKLYGKGAVLDAPTDGANVKMQRHQFATTGQIILSEIWAKKGAIGIVPKEGEGALVTSHFFLFDVVETKILREFIGLLLKRNYFAEALDAQARGTTGYAAVRPKQFLSLEIPLPPLDEQRRIVERVGEIAACIAKAQSLRDEADRETEIILLAIRHIVFDDHKEYKRKRLDNLCTIVRGSSPRPKGDTRFYGGDVPRLLIADISRDGKYVTPKIDSLTDEGAKLSRPMPKGSLVIAISGSYGVPAFLAVDACIHDGFIGFRDIDSSIDPEYLYQVLLLSKPYFDSVVKDSGLKNLTTSHLKNLDIPVPPLDEQRRIVAYLDSVQARLASLRELQSETQEELDALMPSVLDRAFKGEL